MKKRKNILFIASRLPINTETGDRLRTYHFIRKLVDRGHRVDVLGFVPAGGYEIRTNIENLCGRCIGIERSDLEFEKPSRMQQLYLFAESFFSGYPYRVWHLHDRQLEARAEKMTKEYEYDIIHLSVIDSAMVFRALKKANIEATFVFDFIDSLALSLKSSPHKKWSIRGLVRLIDYYRLKKFEQQILQETDQAIFISNRDKQFLNDEQAWVIPNGVKQQKVQNRPRDIDILFTGNMAAKPNVDAAFWFAKNIMPAIREHNKSFQFYIVGTHPPKKIRSLAGDHIQVTGFVDDINEYYQRAKVFVCPMRYGAGQKNKILEAMMNRAPVVSTTEGNIGIDAPPNVITLADSAESFSKQVLSLLNDEKQRNQMAQNGHQFVHNNFYWERSVNLLEECYEA